MNTFHKLQSIVLDFVKARNWAQFHSPKNLAMSISIESAELMELFQWLTLDQSRAKLQDLDFKEKVEDEIADILIYTLSFANSAEINLEAAILRKIKKNSIKYPVE